MNARNPESGEPRGSWKSYFRFCGKIVFFILADFKLIDQPMQVSSRHAQAARTLHFVPAMFAQGPKNEPAFELADFPFIRTVDDHGRIGTDKCLVFVSVAANPQRQIGDVHGLSLGQNDGALHGIFELPDVARPGIFLERK